MATPADDGDPCSNVGGVAAGVHRERDGVVVAGILRSIASLLPAAVALIAAVNVACAVLATAADSGCDVTYVLAVQVIRVFVMLLAIPLLARILTCRTT